MDGVEFTLIRNRRAKNFIFRLKGENMYITSPYAATNKEIETVIRSNKGKIMNLLELATPEPLIDFNFKIESEYFNLSICPSEEARSFINREGESIQVMLDNTVDFRTPSIQKWLVKVIENVLKERATNLIPPLAYNLASQLDLKVNQVKIGLSKGRWGSCSSIGNINLSAYILLLPKHLMIYVILHEFAHLTEMNHSKNFWNLLDGYCSGCSKQWNRELKKYKTSFLLK